MSTSLPPNQQHYQAAFRLAVSIDEFLKPDNRHGGGAHFRRRDGRALIHFDQVLRAIMEDDLDLNHAERSNH